MNQSIKKLLTRSFLAPTIFLSCGIFLASLEWLNPLLHFNKKWMPLIGLLNDIGIIIIALGLTLFLFTCLIIGCDYYEHYFNRTERKNIAHLFSILKNGLKLLFVLVGINIVISFFELKNAYYNFVYNSFIIISIIFVAWVILQIFSVIEMIIRSRSELPLNKDTRKLVASYTKIHIIKNIASLIVIIVAFAAVMMIFDKVKNIGISILASVGFLTAIVALAAQRPINTIFTGFQLVLSEVLKIGDLVFVEKEYGMIEEITLTYVVVKIWDSRRLILPIKYFLETPYQNWSAEGLLGTSKLYVSYNCPIEPLRKELTIILKQSQLWDKKLSKLFISSFKESTIEVTAMYSAMNPSDLDNLGNEVREKLLNYIQINYPNELPVRLTTNLYYKET